jgi:hypothetical protein
MPLAEAFSVGWISPEMLNVCKIPKFWLFPHLGARVILVPTLAYDLKFKPNFFVTPPEE